MNGATEEQSIRRPGHPRTGEGTGVTSDGSDREPRWPSAGEPSQAKRLGMAEAGIEAIGRASGLPSAVRPSVEAATRSSRPSVEAAKCQMAKRWSAGRQVAEHRRAAELRNRAAEYWRLPDSAERRTWPRNHLIENDSVPPWGRAAEWKGCQVSGLPSMGAAKHNDRESAQATERRRAPERPSARRRNKRSRRGIERSTNTHEGSRSYPSARISQRRAHQAVGRQARTPDRASIMQASKCAEASTTACMAACTAVCTTACMTACTETCTATCTTPCTTADSHAIVDESMHTIKQTSKH